MDENAALHQNGIEICQKVNGGISFHLTAHENDVRRCTTLYDVIRPLLRIVLSRLPSLL